AGGLRHCKKYEAFGLLNVNDIVLAILQLLKDHDLVVHVDIDIHLSDDIFYSTDRVFMTVYSYFWRLFMGTGHQDDIGVGIDKYYSLNVPLEDGIDDESYQYLLQHLNPKQDLSLSIKGHAECVGYEIFQRSPTVVGWSQTQGFYPKIPLFVQTQLLSLFIKPNAAFPLESSSSAAANGDGNSKRLELEDKMPPLHVAPSNMENKNTRGYLDEIKAELLHNI
ncbi:hypothetical protein CISIN_1g0476081mg, partial [Citrus sinensis]